MLVDLKRFIAQVERAITISEGITHNSRHRVLRMPLLPYQRLMGMVQNNHVIMILTEEAITFRSQVPYLGRTLEISVPSSTILALKMEVSLPKVRL